MVNKKKYNQSNSLVKCFFKYLCKVFNLKNEFKFIFTKNHDFLLIEQIFHN